MRVQAENPITGETTHTNSATLVYVALDDEGHPCPVPRLILESDAEREAFAEAEARQKARLQAKGR